MLSVIHLLGSSSWIQPRWARRSRQITNQATEEPEDDDHRGTTRRLIERGLGAESYHDEPNRGATDTTAENHEEGTRVVPSALVDTGNEWRD